MKQDHADMALTQLTKYFAETRKAKGLSHETVARKAGVTRPAISHIESGRRKPGLLVCLRIAHALDLKLWEILKKIER